MKTLLSLLIAACVSFPGLSTAENKESKEKPKVEKKEQRTKKEKTEAKPSGSKSECCNLSDPIAAIEKHVAKLRENLKKKEAAVEADHKKHHEAHDATLAEVKKLKVKLAASEKHLAESKKHVDDRDKKIADLTNKVKQAEGQIATAKKADEKNKSQVVDLSKKIRATEILMAKSKGESEKAVRELKQKLKTVQDESGAKVAALQKKGSGDAERIKKLESELAAAKKHCADASKVLSHLCKKLEEMVKENEK